MDLEHEISKTQKILQPLIDRPQLKDKVSSVTRSTGFARDLYAGDELNSGAIKDKDSKLNYLKKIVDCVNICLGEKLDVRGAKVVAGLEPEKTNQFLQALGECASDNSLDFAAATQLALSGTPPLPINVPRLAKPKAEAKDVDSGILRLNEETLGSEAPPSRARARVQSRDSKNVKNIELVSRQGDMGLGIVPPGLDEQIEACDGTTATTRALLEPIITRPKLSDKLLGKPPFRFIHDIISEVTRQTSFAFGLYDESESDSTKVTEKSAKVEYLEKMVKLVGMHLNTIVEARPAKIVSGLEPNNTNRLLQLLAIAASSLPNSTEAVRAVLASEEKGAFDRSLPPEAQNKGETNHPSEQQETTAHIDVKNDTIAGGVTAAQNKNLDAANNPTRGDENLNPTQLKRSIRPTTARRRPPKYKAKSANHEEDDAKQGTGSSVNGKIAIMVDGDDTIDDDGSIHGHDDSNLGAMSLETTSGGLATDGRSKLVREIQEEERNAFKPSANPRSDIAGGIRFGRIDYAVAGKTNKLSQADLCELQQSIQLLCQSTNPLGKCMDYIHEDLSTMNKEYEKWQLDYKAYNSQLEQEFKLTSEVTQPLRLKLKEIDDKISDEHKNTHVTKARVVKQEDRIGELLRMVCCSSF